MKRLLDLMGMTIGSAIGWALGAYILIFTAFVVSMIGTGLGLYGARRLSKRLLG